jgi:hypothetical protein
MATSPWGPAHATAPRSRKHKGWRIKRTLIIAKTLAEAADHARSNQLENWQFVVSARDLAEARPRTHTLAFAGHWYERADLKKLRRRCRGRGLDTPDLGRTTPVHGTLAEAAQIIEDLCEGGINGHIAWSFDDGFQVSLGAGSNVWTAYHNVRSWIEAADWLRSEAIRRFPASSFGRKYHQ